MKKTIFISYSPDTGFLERKFIVETVKQLKENDLGDDIWFDRDEKNSSTPCWFSTRIEAVEKCHAAVLFISNCYLTNSLSLTEMKILLDRHRNILNSLKLFPILFDKLNVSLIDKQKELLDQLTMSVDLTGTHNCSKSVAEKVSIVVGSLMDDLEKVALVLSKTKTVTPLSSEFNDEFRKKIIFHWSISDVQEWLFHIGITEYYRQCLAEAGIDGFLLLSLSSLDLNLYIGIDNKIMRRKILQQMLHTLELEQKREDKWHLRARSQKPKANVAYIIYDPADVRLAQNLKEDLKEKNMQVIHHNTTKLGHSKEEFIEINGPPIATASQVIIIMTEEASTSPFVYQEVMFADWLGKKITVALFKNIWNTLRSSLKAILGQCPAVDFENEMYAESLDILQYHIQPVRHVPAVVLEQSYLNRMTDGVKPFCSFASSRSESLHSKQMNDMTPVVFLSYQWDSRTQVNEIQEFLKHAGYTSWADFSMASEMHGCSGVSLPIPLLSRSNTVMDSLQSQMYRTMKSCHVVLCCLTPKYLQSDNCMKDLSLASSLQRPIIPLLLRYVSKDSVRRAMSPFMLNFNCIDLSNERLFKQNIASVIQRIQRIL
ncbi:CAunnamed protein product [Biomphalaria glabrata]|nr:CAunnamed protein product [Biomphalaria glabrata]